MLLRIVLDPIVFVGKWKPVLRADSLDVLVLQGTLMIADIMSNQQVLLVRCANQSRLSRMKPKRVRPNPSGSLQ
jgi:multidrug efflux pump subunit AcrB